jgi:hypothetical protein
VIHSLNREGAMNAKRLIKLHRNKWDAEKRKRTPMQKKKSAFSARIRVQSRFFAYPIKSIFSLRFSCATRGTLAVRR